MTTFWILAFAATCLLALYLMETRRPRLELAGQSLTALLFLAFAGWRVAP